LCGGGLEREDTLESIADAFFAKAEGDGVFQLSLALDRRAARKEDAIAFRLAKKASAMLSSVSSRSSPPPHKSVSSRKLPPTWKSPRP